LRLGIGHHLALLPVKNVAQKKLLAESAIAGGWTAEELRAEVARLQKPHAGGRPPSPPLHILIERAAKLFHPDGLLSMIHENADQISPSEQRRLLAKAQAITASLERIQRILI